MREYRKLNPDQAIKAHAAMQEAARATIAPVGTFWRHRGDQTVWKLVERIGPNVLLRRDEPKGYRGGALQTMLANYDRVLPS